MSRHRVAGAARRARRPQAGAPPRPLRDVRRRLPPRPRVLQVRPRRRRRDGQYHPHGDSAIYDTLVRLGAAVVAALPAGRTARATSARPATTRPPPCATPSAGWRRWPWRWCATSTRTPSTSRPTTTDAPQEPVVLPSRFPNLLVNGSGRHRGRHGHQHPAAQPARGSAAASSGCSPTPRRRREELLEALLERIKGPDFPTGGLIVGRNGASRTPTAPVAARS